MHMPARPRNLIVCMHKTVRHLVIYGEEEFNEGIEGERDEEEKKRKTKIEASYLDVDGAHGCKTS
jgi:hypothetical protein